MAKFAKTDPGTLIFKIKLFATIANIESCKELHLIHGKVFKSAPDFFISHHYM